jgi:S1-C subfamily serine protease
MPYYDFRDDRGFYQENTRTASPELFRQEFNSFKSNAKKALIIFVLLAVLINALAIYLLRQDMIATLSDEIREEVTASVKEELTEDILRQYRREYYLPDGYTPIGLMVSELAIDSILELICASSGVTGRATAIVINEQGYIITNAHVITYERPGILGGRAVYSSIKGNFANSTAQYTLEVVDYDINKDLALLKFKTLPSDLKPIIFSDSDMINLGEECVVMGNAEGMGTSVTTGCISNTPRNYDGTEVIQTDAAINPGNSGGPILNVYGELVAIATFKIVASEASEGMGFGITVNEARNYIDRVNLLKGLSIGYTLAE